MPAPWSLQLRDDGVLIVRIVSDMDPQHWESVLEAIRDQRSILARVTFTVPPRWGQVQLDVLAALMDRVLAFGLPVDVAPPDSV